MSDARSPLEQGAGRGRVLFLDAPAGIAGDMTVAALVDLGVPFRVVEAAVAALPVDVRVELVPALAGAIGGSRFLVHPGPEQPERDYRSIDAMLAEAELDEHARALARAVFRTLATAESRVHRVPVEQVHFHEVGAVDAIADIVAAAACFAHLGAEVRASSLPMGRGTVDCAHGRLPLPPPATVECLSGVPTHYAGIDEELVTPTGAAIAKTLVQRWEPWPDFAPERTGWGCGTKELPDRPNALRVVLGRTRPLEARDEPYVLLEANVDDMTGELAGHVIGALLAAGAVDAWAIPVTMKKGRPGLTLCALAERTRSNAMGDVLLRETTTIGVRLSPRSRIERPRRMVRVVTRFGEVPVKVSEGPYGPPLAKPEFDRCAELAELASVPVREVIRAALAAFDAHDDHS